MLNIQINTMAMLLSEFEFLPIYRADLAGSRTLSFTIIYNCGNLKSRLEFGDLNLMSMVIVFLVEYFRTSIWIFSKLAQKLTGRLDFADLDLIFKGHKRT